MLLLNIIAHFLTVDSSKTAEASPSGISTFPPTKNDLGGSGGPRRIKAELVNVKRNIKSARTTPLRGFYFAQGKQGDKIECHRTHHN